MDCFVNLKKKMMKRKDLDDLDEDFSDFSLSSPARKIRRLDMELPPMMEDEDTEIVIPSDEPSPGARQAGMGPVIEELPTSSASPLPVPANEERAIVLFTPVNGSSLLQNSLTTMSLSVDPNLIAGFRRHYRGANLHIDQRAGDDDEVEAADELNACKAMVPWVPPSQLPNVSGSRTAEAPDSMEDAEMGEAFMEIEEEDTGSASSKNNFSSLYGEAAKGSDSMASQWPHCMTPQVPPAPSSPIVWFR